MKQKRTKSTLLAFLLPAFLLCACTVGNEPGLPDGRYPITFAASVDGLIASRATTENTWNGTEKVAIQIGNGEVKKYTAVSGGNLTVTSGDPFYWQNTNDITVNAWYPYNDTKPAAADLKVKADQSQNTNYQASDYLEAVGATVTFVDPTLTFKHRTAKVIVKLKEGEGVTNVSGATVKFLNQTGVDGGGAEVVSKTEPSGTATYTALLIPQQMQGQQFISVTLTDGGDNYTYYYTPTQESEANLQSGMQYTYEITVKNGSLEVTTNTSSSQWTQQDGSDETVIGEEKNNS